MLAELSRFGDGGRVDEDADVETPVHRQCGDVRSRAGDRSHRDDRYHLGTGHVYGDRSASEIRGGEVDPTGGGACRGGDDRGRKQVGDARQAGHPSGALRLNSCDLHCIDDGGDAVLRLHLSCRQLHRDGGERVSAGFGIGAGAQHETRVDGVDLVAVCLVVAVGRFGESGQEGVVHGPTR